MNTKPARAATLPHTTPWARLAWADLLSLALLAGAALFLLTRLEGWVPWYDEGWNLEVARTWAEQGHYGIIAADGPRGKSLAGAFSTIAPIALSFKLLGVGLWQGRLPSALEMLAALVLLALLARSLGGPRVAAATLATALLTTNITLNPLGIGSQALAEPVMILFLAGAYLALPAALARPWPWMPLFWLLAGLALAAKSQPLPFVVVSLLAPAGLALVYGRRREVGLLGLALAGALATMVALPMLQDALLGESTAPSEPIPNLTRIVSATLDIEFRVTALAGMVAGAGPAMLGVAYALWRQARVLPAAAASPQALGRTALLALTASWSLWYLLLSIGWPRYLAPPAFFAAFFAAEMLERLTSGFDLHATLGRLRPGPSAPQRLLVAVPLVILHVYCFHALVRGIDLRFNNPVVAREPAVVAAWLNANTPAGALVETYEAELLFALDRPFYYPPDRHHGEILLMHQQRPGARTSYEPLALAPDYIVVGPFGAQSRLYDEAIEASGYRLVLDQERYQVYMRSE